jgi:protein SCO1/2
MCRSDYSEVMVRRRPAVPLSIALFSVAAMVGGCKAESARTYALRGQILAISAEAAGRRSVTIRHEDIRDFMPAMTMAYDVKPPAQLDGFVPGDFVAADLVFTAKSGELYLANLKKTSHADVPADARAAGIMDVMNPGDPVPDDPLQDQTGATRKLSDWRGRALAVTFVYTRCPLPDFCPLLDRHFGELQRAIESDPRLRDRVHLVSVSFDPGHDTPDILRDHAKLLRADPQTWSFLTGAPAAIDHITSRFGVSAITQNDRAQTMTHNLRTAVIDREGRLVKFYSGTDWTVDGLLADLREAGGS